MDHGIATGQVLNLKCHNLSLYHTNIKMIQQPISNLTIDIWPDYFSKEEQKQISENSEEYNIPTKGVVHPKGKPVESIYMLVDGKLELVDPLKHSVDEKNYISPGSLIGIISFLKGEPVTHQIEAVEETRLLKVDPEFLLEIWILSNSRRLQLLRFLVERYTEILNSEEELKKKSSLEMLRFADWLDRIHDKVVSSEDFKVSISLNDLEDATGLNKQDIISALGEMIKDNQVSMKSIK